MLVNVQDHPQLTLLCWNRPGVTEIGGAEALALYERNWRFVDEEALTPSEHEMIDELTRLYGNGTLNV